MTLGAPAALWGLCAVPLLVALYLLRVRRREHPVSSILLWQRSAPTPAASRPTRRIERSVLLALQVLAAGALVVGLARPAIVGRGAGAQALLLVLDPSLSMRARDVVPTRFDRARAEALQAVGSLRPGQRAAVILAAPHPVVLAPLSGDRGRLRAALAAARPWDAPGDVAGAAVLAAQLAPAGDARIVVWTDGSHGPLPALPRVVYRIVGTSDDNVGITALRVVRDPQRAEALVRVENFAGSARRVPLEVRRAGTPIYRVTLALGGGESRAVAIPLALEPGAPAGPELLEARIAVPDALPEDNEAVALLDPAPLPSVLLVGPGNPYIERVLRLLPVARAARTQTVDVSTWRTFGVVILDRVDPGPLPPGNYLLIGTVPPNLPVGASGILARPTIATWDRTDPVLQFVDLDDVRIDRALALGPSGGRVLVEGQGPLLWEYTGRGIRALVLAFALQDSDLPLHVAFPVLMANSLAWLGGAAGEVPVGEAVQVPAGGEPEAALLFPGGRRLRLRATDGMFVLPPLERAGVYRLTAPSLDRRFVATIGGSHAGAIRPGAAPLPHAPSGAAAAPSEGLLTEVPLWPWLLLGAVAAAVGEWALATRRHGGEA